MPRNISFMLTAKQVKARTKTVTRRLGWKKLKPGEILNACKKCQGLKPGEKIERLARIRVVSVRREPLCSMKMNLLYGKDEAKREGFPNWTGPEFVEMFVREMGCAADIFDA